MFIKENLNDIVFLNISGDNYPAKTYFVVKIGQNFHELYL